MNNNLTPASPEERKWGMLIHLSALIGLLLPLGLVLGPLLVWVLKRNESPFLDEQGKKAVNFQLTILIAAFVLVLLSAIIKPLIAIAFFSGFLGLIFAVIASINVSKGKPYDYPFSINLIK